MKRYLAMTTVCLFLLFTATTTSSCSRKSGCPASENATVKPGRKGKLSTRGGNSQLFPKDMRSKKKRSRR